MGSVIEADRLTKRYGKRTGVVDLGFEVRPGEVFGFLGPNGAGKTTTIRTLLDLIRPTSGRASLFGLDSHRHSREIRRRIGYLPGELALYERLTAGEHMAYLAHLRGGVDANAIESLAGGLNLDLSSRIRMLSHGNRQKVGLVQAFMHRPELLLLDEPTLGLDPLAQHEVHRLVDGVRREGRTVFLSSHILPEVEELCDRVGIIREGRLVTVRSIAELKAAAVRVLELHFASSTFPESFRRLPGVRDVTIHGNVLRLSVTGSVDPVIKEAARHTVVNVVSEEPTLEEIFFGYYEEAPADAS